jgi:hypothetical protein
MPWEENRQLPACSRANGMDKSPYDCRGCHEKRERDHIPYGSAYRAFVCDERSLDRRCSSLKHGGLRRGYTAVTSNREP